MATKMTAVQWLEIAVQNKLKAEMGPYFAEAFEQAKQMEKEQIIAAHYYGGVDFQEAKECRNQEVPYLNEAEDYYTSNYNQ